MEQPFYRNSGIVVRGLMWLSVLFLGVMLYLATLVPADPLPEVARVDESLAARVVQVLGVLLGVGFMAGMVVYGRLYVTELVWGPARERLDVETIGWFRRHRFSVPVEDVLAAESRGEQSSYPVVVNTQWTAVRLRGRRLPLIVDHYHGDTLDEGAMRLLEWGEDPWAPPPARPPTATFRRQLARQARARKRRRGR